MDIFLKEEEIVEIKPITNSEDKARTIITPDHSNAGRPTKEEERTDVAKELIANDVITLGAREAALIHGVSKTQAADYANGKNVKDPDVKTRILDQRHDIQDLALTKLMETLQLLDPTNVDRERDKVTIINGLSQVVERLSENNKNGNVANVVHLELYMPPQKKESDYKVIEA